MSKLTAKSVVFITGTFIGNNCWDEWMIYYESHGYECIAPAWPHKQAAPEDLRNRHPDPAIASNTLEDLTSYFAAIANSLPEQPIMIGHSLGGLIVQLLLQRGIGAAGVAIHSFSFQSAQAFNFSFLKAIWIAFGFGTSTHKTYMMSFRKWRHDIANKMTCDEQKALFYRYAIPESKKIIRDTFKCVTKINFGKSHAPLLFTSGGRDKLVPAELNYSNFEKYSDINSITDYKEFKSHNHLVFGQFSGTEEAQYVLNWLQELKYIY